MGSVEQKSNCRLDGAMLLQQLMGVHDKQKWAAILDQVLEGARLQAVENEWREITSWKPFLHWCDEWDGLLVDEKDAEFEACNCFEKDKHGAKIPWKAVHDSNHNNSKADVTDE